MTSLSKRKILPEHIVVVESSRVKAHRRPDKLVPLLATSVARQPCLSSLVMMRVVRI